MNEVESKREVQKALQAFETQPIAHAATGLLRVLGYSSDKLLTLSPNKPMRFLELFDRAGEFKSDVALLEDWRTVDFVCQLTDDEVRASLSSKRGLVFDSRGKFEDSVIESFVFLAIELAHPDERAGERRSKPYSRTELSNITRAVNRLFAMPALLFLKYGDQLTIAIINRRLHRRDAAKDVLEKVTLIKDIGVTRPHRAHVEILFELSIEHLSRTHEIRNFVGLHKAWQATLNISELNKRFYQDIANWYFWACTEVAFPVPSGVKDRPQYVSQSVIRLITRLVFCWFLKEKGLVPDGLFSRKVLESALKDTNSESSSYYKAILQNLFFATLNQEMGNGEDGKARRQFRKDGQNFMAHNLFRYRALFSKPQEALKLFEAIPFMNGGLFECLDKTVGPKDNPTYIRIDGFSDREDNPLRVPNHLFFGDEREVDLSDEFGESRYRATKVRGLIETLSRYKFTVAENTPIEEEIALDPELLGKVFENLLAAFNPETGITARKQTGSFYTPREIVDYMVDEALVSRLKSALAARKKASGDIEPKLRQLFSYTEQKHSFDDEEVDALVAAIDELKIIDPACGSGAFPMGVLHKLVFVLAKLDPGNQRWKAKQVAKAAEIADVTIRENTLTDIETTFESNELDYGRKLFLIEKCIYGVDIQPIAVQISKLRFFISLVVDQELSEDAPNRGVRPLPNLETKFVAANTLIALERPKQRLLRNTEIDVKHAELKHVRQRHFIARTPSTKAKCRADDKRLREEIAALLKKDGWNAGVAGELAAWDPYDQNASAGFFDAEWMFEIKEGFDICIGNPPYLRVQGIQQTQPEFVDLYKKRFESATGAFDLYALFVERCYGLLKKEQGCLAFVLPHKFFNASFGEALREMLTQRKALSQIVRFGTAQVFEEATTYTCLLFLSATPKDQFVMAEVARLDDASELFPALNIRAAHPDLTLQTLPAPKSTSWDFSLGENSRVLARLKKHPRTLGDITRKIFQGIPTGADKIFVLSKREGGAKCVHCFSKQLEEEVEIEHEMLRPFLMGKDVHRYEPVPNEAWVLFPYRILNGRAELMPQSYIREKYPKAWTYLKENRDYLESREGGRFADNWHCFSRPQNLTEFETPKLMTPDICGRPEVSIDQTGTMFHTTTLYSFVFNGTYQAPLEFFLGLLNSKVLWFFISETGTPLRGGYYRFKTEYLRPSPIPESNPEQQKAISTLASYVLRLREAKSHDNPRTSHILMASKYFEQLIDALVYELYLPEEFEHGNSMFSLVSAIQLPPVPKKPKDAVTLLFPLFEKLFAPDHPIRKALFFLDSSETIQVIERKSRANQEN
ncbi:MAG: hypothetical protein DPW14_09650 [Planctomycetes bacterium]|nr:hypothetical protein [Planctomycetota bacterium]